MINYEMNDNKCFVLVELYLDQIVSLQVFDTEEGAKLQLSELRDATIDLFKKESINKDVDDWFRIVDNGKVIVDLFYSEKPIYHVISNS